GIPIFQAEIRTAFTAKGALARLIGNLASALDESVVSPKLPLVAKLNKTASPTEPAFNAEQAIAFAAATLDYSVNAATLQVSRIEKAGHLVRFAPGPFTEESSAELFYFPLGPGLATLAYDVVLTEQSNAWYIFVDAYDGTLLFRKNLTAHQ